MYMYREERRGEWRGRERDRRGGREGGRGREKQNTFFVSIAM